MIWIGILGWIIAIILSVIYVIAYRVSVLESKYIRHTECAKESLDKIMGGK
jgi:cell division protein FtsX